MKKNELIEQINRVWIHSKSLKRLVDKYEEIIILGNGGSNSVASHISQDYTKVLKKRAYTFSDPSRLTCYINDYGMANANEQFLKEFANTKTLVILMSSSGNSENMLRAVMWCAENYIPTIVLTGFEENNKLTLMDFPTRVLNIWVDSTDYGVVECVHQVFLHSILGSPDDNNEDRINYCHGGWAEKE